ncbi:hypothetical protein PCYB_146850 [Plasmodium cynomolgi strain B]|uniref:Uncharacterized protein n=1 Tax=Plasmodium cynomolgi (strain B) TaxID=1120755 RepID=K6VIP3_PLACD|nr:hypothetical protein PCYB_146850 [Plasmodium cynomolgi strain B]GAB69257.1 hypothetical protein PCYB_146850 [Plasmodium cynomolgi strain B]
MFDKFKNIVNLNNSGAEKDEAKKAEANENPEASAPVQGDPSLEGAEEKTFFDEMLGAPQYTYEQFLKVLKSPQEERGDTDDLKKHWGYPRRWKVILWDLHIQNYMSSDFNAFVDFDFGGNREECRIQVKRLQHENLRKGEDEKLPADPCGVQRCSGAKKKHEF